MSLDSISTADADAALHATLLDVLAGEEVPGAKSSVELLHYKTGMANARARITTAPSRPLSVIQAVARFVWMVAGNDRLHDIAYYQPKVRDYTDNELTVPGSSYGRRLFNPEPGLDQIAGVVARLREDPTSRRAAAVVWSASDAVRESRDIPCTFGMFFHIRAGKLVASTVMRSNNAFLLLPFNIFEFSVLAEVVAAAAGVPVGPYVHWAASMHVYHGFQYEAAKSLVDVSPSTSIEMPPMPGSPDVDPLDQIRRLAVAEAEMRHAQSTEEFDAALTDTGLHDYWIAYLTVLASYGAAKRGWHGRAEELAATLPGHFRGSVEADISKMTAVTEATKEADAHTDAHTDADKDGQFSLDLGLQDEVDLTDDLAQLLMTVPPLAQGAESPGVIAMFSRRLVDYEDRTGNVVGARQAELLRERLYPLGLLAEASRSEKRDGVWTDDKISDDHITAAIKDLPYLPKH